MQEETLLDLYFSRSELALEQTKQQYGTYCYAIAYRILAQPQDAEECENETYWKAWQVIPPNRPHSLKAFLGKITRNLALHFWERNHAAMRGGNAVDLALDELTENAFRRATPWSRQPMQLLYRHACNRFCSNCREKLELYLCSGIGIWIRLQRLPRKTAWERAK